MWILSVPANVRRQISKLPTAALSVEAGDIIEDLAEDPFPADALKMRKYKDHYRIRFGSEAYRIVYRVNFEAADRHNSSGSTQTNRLSRNALNNEPWTIAGNPWRGRPRDDHSGMILINVIRPSSPLPA